MVAEKIFDSYQPITNGDGPHDRFRYAIVEYQNQKLFLKSSLKPAGIGDIRRELVWADFMAFVEENYPGAKLRSPRGCKLLDENSLLMECVDAPVVARPGDGGAWKSCIDRYIDTLIVLDKAAGEYAIPDSLRGYQTRSLVTALKRWLRFTEITSDIEQGYRYVEQNEPILDYRVQHGDLMPWQIFDTASAWVLFDGERAGDDLPRYNDLAYSYGRLAIKCGDSETAEYLVAQFLKRQAMPAEFFWKNYLPVAVFRILGMIGDAIKDGAKKDEQTALALLRSHLDKSIIERIASQLSTSRN